MDSVPRANMQNTWSADQALKQRQEFWIAVRQIGLFLLCLVLVAVIVWGIA